MRIGAALTICCRQFSLAQAFQQAYQVSLRKASFTILRPVGFGYLQSKSI